ncbi:MAG TPA: TetR/AcrR family transcriptional regulator [Gallionella sp.]|nr:TetR/AcrR family transcriptional regulator [Gallionella sp.]
MTTTPIPSRRERKKSEMQERIMLQAVELFRQQGFENTTMEQIASQADVAKRTLYSYFPVKEAIISFYWQSNVDANADRFPQLLSEYPDTRSRLKAVFLSAADAFKADPEFARIEFGFHFQLLGKDPLNQMYQSGFDVFLAAVMEAGQQDGDLRSDISAHEMASQLVWAFTASCLMWFSAPDSFALEPNLEMTVDCFLDGAKAQS